MHETRTEHTTDVAVRRRVQAPAEVAQRDVGRRPDVPRSLRALVAAGPAGLTALGRPSALPHRARLERSFGADLAGITVRVGAGEQLAGIDAGAATLGETIAFGNEAPSLHEVAHEVTHVLQNRSAARAPTSLVSSEHDASEHEAEQAGRDAVAGGEVDVEAAPAAQLQRGPKDWFRKKAGGLKTDADVVNYKAGEGGSLNRVDQVQYSSPIGGDGSTKGYFKPDVQGQEGHSARAVLSSRVDRKLGFNQLSREEFAQHNGETGSVSADLGGSHQALISNVFNSPAGPHDRGAEFKRVNGVNKKMTRQDRIEHDYSNPVTQKSMSDLQLQDAITGQKDRHGGNIMIDTTTGMAKGIDNDQAFDKGVDKTSTGSLRKYLAKSKAERKGPAPAFDPKVLTKQRDKNEGMPDLVDAQSAERVLALKSKTYKKLLKGDKSDPERLDKAAVTSGVQRFKAVKGHVKQLKKDGKLVQNWDQSTYDAATKANAGYLKVAHDDLEGARTGSGADQVRKIDGTVLPHAKATPVAPTVVQQPAPQQPAFQQPTVLPPLPPTPVQRTPNVRPGIHAQRQKMNLQLGKRAPVGGQALPGLVRRPDDVTV